LAKTDEICWAAESMIAQIKAVEDSSTTAVNAVRAAKEPPRLFDSGKPNFLECWNCGHRHEHKREVCPVFGKNCNKCNKKNHFTAKCRSKLMLRSVQTIAEDDEEVFQLGKTGIDNSQQVTFSMQRHSTECVQKSNQRLFSVKCSAITAYGGSIIPEYVTVLLQVQRGDCHCKLDRKLVDRNHIRAILGRNACVGMKIIAYFDNDQVRKPDPRNAQVFSVDEYAPMTKGDMIKKFPTVFGTGVGLVAGEYHI